MKKGEVVILILSRRVLSRPLRPQRGVKWKKPASSEGEYSDEVSLQRIPPASPAGAAETEVGESISSGNTMCLPRYLT